MIKLLIFVTPTNCRTIIYLIYGVRVNVGRVMIMCHDEIPSTVEKMYNCPPPLPTNINLHYV